MSVATKVIASLPNVISAPPAPTEIPLNGLVMAFSHKKLVSSYNGSNYTIQRDSDAATQSFGFNDSAAIATFLGGQTGFVTAWFNQAIATFNFISITAATRPTWNPSNGKLLFDGTDYLRTGATPAAAQAPMTSTNGFSYLIKGTTTTGTVTGKVIFQHAGSTFATVIEIRWNNTASLPRATFAKLSGDTSNQVISGTTFLNNELNTIALTLDYDNDQALLYKDGVQVGSNASFSIDTSEASFPRQFNLCSPGFGTNYWGGEVESVVMYNRPLSLAEVNLVTSLL